MSQEKSFNKTQIGWYTGKQWLWKCIYYIFVFNAFNVLGGVLYPGQWEQRIINVSYIFMGVAFFLLLIYAFYIVKLAHEGKDVWKDVDLKEDYPVKKSYPRNTQEV